MSFATDQPTAARPNTGRALYVAQSQVFDFDPVGQRAGRVAVRMSVVNKDGATLYTLAANAGQTVSGPAVSLPAGGYAVVFEVTGRGDRVHAPRGRPDDPDRPDADRPDGQAGLHRPGRHVHVPGHLVGYDPYLANLIEPTYGLTAPTGDQTVSAPTTDPYMMLPLAP